MNISSQFYGTLLVLGIVIAPFFGPSPHAQLSSENPAPGAEEVLDQVARVNREIRNANYHSYYREYNSGRADSVGWYSADCWMEALPDDSIWGYKLHLKGSDYTNSRTDYYYDGTQAYLIDHSKSDITLFNAHAYGRKDMNNPAKAVSVTKPFLTLMGDGDLKQTLAFPNKDAALSDFGEQWVVTLKSRNKAVTATQTLWVHKKSYQINRYRQEILWNGTHMVYEHVITNIHFNEKTIVNDIPLTESFASYTRKEYQTNSLEPGTQTNLLGREAPNFSYPSLLNGKDLSLASFRGKVILLDFWESWCGYCILAIPRLEELNHKYRTQPFEIIGITTQNEAQIKKLLQKNNIRYNTALAGKKVLDDYGVKARPMYVLIDENGKVVQVSTGKLDPIEAALAKRFATPQ